MGENTIRYVAGFMFDTALKHVVLIQKTKPSWQAGKLNGVGGKVDPEDNVSPGAPPLATMVREFVEETGLRTDMDQWNDYVVLGGSKGDWEVTFFWSVVDYGRLQLVSTRTEEEIYIASVSEVVMPNVNTRLGSLECVGNLSWLVAMAIAHIREVDRCRLHQIFELSYRVP